jgi:hypothetical protein
VHHSNVINTTNLLHTSLSLWFGVKAPTCFGHHLKSLESENEVFIKSVVFTLLCRLFGEYQYFWGICRIVLKWTVKFTPPAALPLGNVLSVSGEKWFYWRRTVLGAPDKSLFPLTRIETHFVFFAITNKCSIISQIITLPHISVPSCHAQGACSQCRAKLHNYFKCSCW